MTGENLPPELPATAQAWRASVLYGQHLQLIRHLCVTCPRWSQSTSRPGQAFPCRASVEAAHRSTRKVAQPMRAVDQSRRQVLEQQPSPTAQRRIVSSAPRQDEHRQADRKPWTSAPTSTPSWPDSPRRVYETPTIKPPALAANPTKETARKELRSHAQRQYDALNILVLCQLGNPKFGTHNDLPVIVTVSNYPHRIDLNCWPRGNRQRYAVAHTRRHPDDQTCLSLPGRV